MAYDVVGMGRIRTTIVLNEESLEEGRTASEATIERRRSEYAARVEDIQKRTSKLRLRKR
jgi:hypothetical protein